MTAGVVAVIQARLRSSRLPGKVLEDLAGRPVLAWVAEACQRAQQVDEVIITIPEGDAPLAALAGDLGIDVVEGPEHDLLRRYQLAAERSDAATIVRVTADCPLLDPAVIDDCVRTFAREPVDYQEARGYPRGAGDADVIRAPSLLAVDPADASDHEREHVGPWFLEPTHRAEVRYHDAPPEMRRPDLRVCVDEPADLQLVRALVERSHGQPIDVATLIEMLDADDALREINAHVRQRS